MKLCRTICTVVLAVALVKGETLASREGADDRIFGGVEVPLGGAPFQVSFQSRGRHFCGGSIIDPNFIVTAAHCCKFESSRIFKIAAGFNHLSTPEDRFQNITVARKIIHPDYSPATLRADICILQLEDSLVLSGERRTAMIKLAPPGYTASGMANVSGWGRASNDNTPDALMRVAVPIIADDLCREKFPSDGHIEYPAVLDEMICAGGEGGKGSCHGDSGGPLVDSQGFLVGVVSWGNPQCGTADSPGVYTEVSYFTQWIKNVLANSNLEVLVSS